MKVITDDGVKEMKCLWYENKKLKFIDQRFLPHKLSIYIAKSYNDVSFAIKNMIVRGAPAIGVAAAYGMVLGHECSEMEKCADVLRNTRPTAHDLFHAIDYVWRRYNDGEAPLKSAREYEKKILNECKKIGEVGSKIIKDGYRILTHCNAGALATVDYGTALSPIRIAHYSKKKLFVYVNETRPLLQGARLTSWELLNEGINHAVIPDNAAGYYMYKGVVDLVIVGADRIAMNGDFVNKIGTYEKAVVAHELGIPFYVCAPRSTFDKKIECGDEIVIEERSPSEVHEIDGKRITPKGANAKNPAFDITPAKYVSGFVTDDGIISTEDVRKWLG